MNLKSGDKVIFTKQHIGIIDRRGTIEFVNTENRYYRVRYQSETGTISCNVFPDKSISGESITIDLESTREDKLNKILK